MIEPMTAMYAALEAVAEGKAKEVELEWTETQGVDVETRLVITVRKEIKNFVVGGTNDAET